MTATAERPVGAPAGADGRWRRAASIGAVAAAASLLALMALAGEVIPPVIVIATLFVVLSVVLRRVAARWPVYVGIVFPLLAIGGNATFIIADVSHPESAAGFVPATAVLLSALFTAAASLLARTGATLAVRPVAGATVTIGLVALVGSAVATATLDDDKRQDGDVAVLASNVEYPGELRVEAGDVGFFIENDDVIRHTFLIEGTGVDQEVPGSTARRVTADLGPGTYRYFCDVPGHEDMEGTIVVE